MNNPEIIKLAGKQIRILNEKLKNRGERDIQRRYRQVQHNAEFYGGVLPGGWKGVVALGLILGAGYLVVFDKNSPLNPETSRLWNEALKSAEGSLGIDLTANGYSKPPPTPEPAEGQPRFSRSWPYIDNGTKYTCTTVKGVSGDQLNSNPVLEAVRNELGITSEALRLLEIDQPALKYRFVNDPSELRDGTSSAFCTLDRSGGSLLPRQQLVFDRRPPGLGSRFSPGQIRPAHV